MRKIRKQKSKENDLSMFLKTSNTSKEKKMLARMWETAFSLGKKNIYSS